jgi:2-phosphoglycerate kinase
MADANPKFIGDLGINQFENYISIVVSGADREHHRKRLIKNAGLESASDPFERIFSAYTSHIEQYGATEEIERKVESIGRAYKSTEEMPHAIKEFLNSVKSRKRVS